MKRYMNHTATIGMLAFLIGVGAGAPEALAGDGACTFCTNCPDGMTACFPGGTPVSACLDIGCGADDTSDECEVAGCPTSEAGQCDDGVNNDAYQNSDTDCADAACASDPACAPTGACCYENEGTPWCEERHTASECTGLPSGVYMGDGSTCCDDGCATFSEGGACCGGGAGASCFVSDEAGCASGKPGIFHGVGTTCDPADPDHCLAEPTFCPPEPVPTVSEWGFVAMVLLALAAGSLVFAKRGRHVTA